MAAEAVKIELSGLSRSYRIKSRNRQQAEHLVALQDFTLSVKSGEFLAVVGPSGCGKSTLLDIVSGLNPPSGGTILIDGKAVTKPALDRGLIMQGYALFPWRTVFRNIEYGLEVKGLPARQRHELVRQFISLVDLEGFEDRYPHELSGGMRQRVAIARALAFDPEVLLMDEPFAAVDAQTRETLQDELLKIWGQTSKTVMFITHSIEEAVLLADRVAILTPRPGKIKAIVDITLPRPRYSADVRLSADYGVLVRKVWEILHDSSPGDILDSAVL